MVTNTDITSEPEKKIDKIPVIDFDFKFSGNELLQITVWPTLGDTWNYIANEGYHFSFERLKTEQDVFKINMLGVTIHHDMRAPFTMEEFRRRMAEIEEQKKKAYVEAKQG